MIHKDDFKNEYIYLSEGSIYPDIAVSYHQINNNIYGWYTGKDINQKIITNYFWIELDDKYINALKILMSKNTEQWNKDLISGKEFNDFKITKPQKKALETTEKSFKRSWVNSAGDFNISKTSSMIQTPNNDKMLIPENLNFPLLSLLSNFWELEKKIELSYIEQ